ncbi:hypothetical protein DPMN_061269 [Dreissena polymorpha]|uniref:Uncharacterized protein n=1 Tax=Dreissena polymorpha TaxID=45954 RepID=A0A9D4C743_DREPO|nr:hypothetical protein DPMN_061269 [Dreissena polymorpha]
MLPVNSGKRSSFANGLFLTFGVFLTTVSSELPKNAEEMSYLSVYIVIISIFNCMIVAICLVQIRLGRRENKEREKPKHPPGPIAMWIYEKHSTSGAKKHQVNRHGLKSCLL